MRPTAAPPSSTTKAPGSASSRNISSTRTAVRSASRKPAIPAPQGPYYTGVGYSNVGDVARKIVEEHLDLCLAAGINHEGINAEVAKGQWEFQIFGKGSKKAADEMWMARYLLQRLTEKYGIDIEFHCKPLGDTDWNGSGMHANFSTKYMREVGGKAYFEALMAAFDKNLMDHIAVYGPDNDKRLTGKHETAPWNKFSYGVADRGASIRVPHSFVKNDYKGYLEDRRPNSQGDPYQIASQILKTISPVPRRGRFRPRHNHPSRRRHECLRRPKPKPRHLPCRGFFTGIWQIASRAKSTQKKSGSSGGRKSHRVPAYSHARFQRQLVGKPGKPPFPAFFGG